ncbi:MAG: HAD-IA family hydrolase [candidate division Zixibacteria bacterium]|nr:HAD-IA family hydrolase [candidate division Zixibacteria bacterium]
MLKGMLFDLGSTLIDYDRTQWERLEQDCLVAAHGYLSSKFNVPEQGLFKKLFMSEFHQAWQEADDSLIELRFADWVSDFLIRHKIAEKDGAGHGFEEKYYDTILKQIKLIDGAREMLEEFKQKGLKIGLISNSSFPAEFHLREMEQFGIAGYFDFTVFSSDFGYRKPHKELFNLALGKLKLSPHQAVYLGDKLREDVGGAKGAGMKGILKFTEGRDYTYDVTPDAVVHSLNEVVPTVERLFSK